MMVIVVVIVLWTTKVLGGTSPVIIPTSMVCTWEQERLVAPECNGTTGAAVIL